MTRQPSVSVALRCNMRRSRHQRNAVRVLPVPVGARIRVLSPRAIAGQPSRWGAVGCSKTARNQEAVTGWKRARTFSVRVGFLAAIGAASRIAVRGDWVASLDRSTYLGLEKLTVEACGFPFKPAFGLSGIPQASI